MEVTNRIPEALESWRGEKNYRGLLRQVWLVPQQCQRQDRLLFEWSTSPTKFSKGQPNLIKLNSNPDPNPNPNNNPRQLLVQPCRVEFPTYTVLGCIEWKTYFYLFPIKPGYCELKLTKKRFRLLASKIRCFHLYRTRNMFPA